MDDSHPTEPLPPAHQGQPYPPPPYGAVPQPSAVPGEPFYNRHGLAFAISTLVLAVILLIGLAGAGAFAVGAVLLHAGSTISHAVHGGGQIPVQPRRNQGGTTGGGQNGGNQNGRQDEGPLARGVVRGSLVSIDGSSWTILTPRGATLRVVTSSSTAYGAPGQSQKASDFAPGDEIIVIGTRSGTTVTATRILKVSDLPLRPPSLPGTTATPGATPGS